MTIFTSLLPVMTKYQKCILHKAFEIDNHRGESFSLIKKNRYLVKVEVFDGPR